MVFNAIAELIADRNDCDVSEITRESTFADLGIDSLDMTEMAMDLEDEFSIEFTPSPEINTVGKLVEAVEKLVEG